MLETKVELQSDVSPQETNEWMEALDGVVEENGPERAAYLLGRLIDAAAKCGEETPNKWTTPYVNTNPVEEEVAYPGDRDLERRIKSLLRWNAMAMVVRANKHDPGIGGHISTYASLATLTEVGHNHFFHARYDDQPGDFVYFQGHASPGTYARAYLEGRINEKHLENFRHELRDEPGLSSYPHPWLMPDFWQFPTVSMGLGPINAIYQARFMRYLENTGVLIKSMGECVDGEYQNFKAKGGAYVRKEFFGRYPELLKLVEHMSDEEIGNLRRGGHDPQKVYNAYKRATEHTGSPTVILAKTIKGYGLGEAGEGRNVTHQQKKLDEDEMLNFRRRFDIPISEETVHTTSFYKPAEDSPELSYMPERGATVW